MKKRKTTCYTLVLIALCAAVILAFAGCAPQPTIYEPTGLTWVSQPKTLYYVGETFDPSDTAIQIVYNNESSRTVVRNLKDMTLDEYSLVNFSTEERVFNKEVTLKVGELTLNFYIDVITEADLKTVSFYPENGTTFEDGSEYFFTSKVVVGKSAVKPENPTKEHLTLLDWVTEGGESYNFSAAVQEDLKLRARYFATYQFYNEGRLVKSSRVTEGEDFAAGEVPALPERVGYKVAWRYNDTDFPLSELNPLELENLPLAENYYENATADRRFEAVYIPYTHRVVVDIMGGQIKDDEFYEDENHVKNTVLIPYGYTLKDGLTLFDMDYTVLLEGNLTKQDGVASGYKFAGWYTKDENGEFQDLVDVSSTKIEGDTTIYARWQYGVFFYKAAVDTVVIEGQNVLKIDNAYGLPETVLVDEGKALGANQIPERAGSEYFGYNRWWASSNVGNKPEDVDDFKNEATIETMTSAVGSPSKPLSYYETFYQIRYTVNFLTGDGSALTGVNLEIKNLKFGTKLSRNQVPVRTQISYHKDGISLNFYGWYLDEERNVAFDYERNGIDEVYSSVTVENGTTVGTLNLYADYFAEIGWKDDNAVGASSGTLDESVTRLSRNSVTVGNLPNLKVIPNYDRNWYYDGNLETPAFDDAGKLIVLRNCELIARNKAKEYTVSFETLNTDGGAVDVTLETQRVNTAEPMILPAPYSRWDEASGLQIAGLRDSTGIWELEGYYKDAAFKDKYAFTETVIDGQTVFVSTETFFDSATVYVRFTRVATEGLGFVTYSGGRDYFVQSAEGLNGLSEIVVPETYHGAAVVGIDERAFENFKRLERVFTPDSMREIRDYAFNGCTLLQELPNTAKDAKLGEKVYHGTAWYAAEWKKDYAVNGGYILLGDLSADDTTLYEYLGAKAEEFRIPDGVEIIGSGAFTNQNDRLTGVRIPLSVRIIRTKAFNGALNQLVSVISEDSANLETVESGAFYRLPSLRVLEFDGLRFKSFDNVLYAMENGEKNSLIAYPSAKDAETFIDSDNIQKTYYIIEESVASIREYAFAMCSLDVVVFRRGRNTAISATTLQSDFISQFKETAVFYVPYDLDADGNPVIKSFYENWSLTFGDTRLKPDAFRVEFKSPQASAFGEESGWDGVKWFGFADALASDAESGTVYFPENAESLTLDGIYGNWSGGSFTEEISEGSPVFFDATVYEKWTARITFNARGVPLATFNAPLGSTLDEEQLSRISIPVLQGKNSEWSGTFQSFTDNGELKTYYFGDMSNVSIRYGGDYVVSDTDIVYHVVLNDPYFEEAGYPEFDLTYGMTIPASQEYVPERQGLEFAGWYFGRENTHEFIKMVILGEGGSVFNEELVRNYAGAARDDKTIPVYLWARWYVSVSFYQTSVAADGTETPAKQPSFSVNVDYGSDISAEVRGVPEEYEGYIGTWASYTGNSFVDLNESDFQNVRESFSVYAHYTRKIVTVTFRIGANNEIVLSDLGYGETIPEGKLPTAISPPAGQSFDDWYYDDLTFAKRFDKSKPIYEDTVLYAHFVSIPTDADIFQGDNVENGAGLVFEKVNENDPEGMMQFRLVSARNFKSSVLYLPTTIRGTGEAGAVTTLGTLTDIQAGAFENSGIEHIIIGTSVSRITAGAFRNTANLRKITVASGNVNYKSEDGVLYKTSSPNTVLKYPSAKEGDVYTLPEGYGFAQYSFESPVYLRRIVITGGKPILASGAFSGMDWANFNIYVPTAQLNSYCNKDTHTYDADWVREISADYIERVFRGSTVTVNFVNTLTGENFHTVASIPLYGTVDDPGNIPDPSGYTFGGWCVDREGLTRYVFGKELSDSLTLYARFVRNRTTGLRYTAVAAAGGGVAGYEVSYGSAVDKNVVIPNFYNGYPVIKISENGFLDTGITSLEIPYTLKTIGSGALVGLNALERITVNELNGRTASTAFAVSGNVLYNKDRTTLVLYPAAYGERTTFTAPNTVTNIGEYAFYGNKTLASIELPSSVESIASSAFAKSNLKTLSLRSANRIALRDFNAFSDISDDFRIFVDHAVLADYLAAGSSWFYVASKIYSYTAFIKFYMDAETTTAIAEREYETFRYAAEPNYGNDPELSVIINQPPQGKSFRHWTIRETGEVWNFTTHMLTRDVELAANWVDTTSDHYFVDYTPDQHNYATLALSSSAGTEWTVLTIPSVFNGKPVREIYHNGFSGLRRLTTIVFPASLVRIQANAFKDCTALTTVSFPESLQAIEESAFENCSMLSAVRLPSNMTAIPKAAFKNCTSLSAFDFGSANIDSIGEEAFFGCENLVQPSFPSTVKSIGKSAYEGCIGIARLTLPERLETVGDRAFFGNSKLISVSFLGNRVKTIGSSAFQSCAALTDIILPEGLLAVSANMFYGDSALKSIVIPNSVKFINDGAFRYCTGLVEVKFGTGIDVIGNYAFSETAVSLLELPASLTTIGDNAFAANSYLRKIYLKGVPQSIGVKVFGLAGNLSIFAENDEVYAGFLGMYNFESEYEKQFMKRYITITFRYVGANGAELSTSFEAESDKVISEPQLSQLEGFSYPEGADDYSYRAGYWYTVRTNEETKVTYEVSWNFRTDTVREDTTLTMRYIVSPNESNESSDGLNYRLLSGDLYEVAGVGSLSNKSTIVIPNYYQRRKVVSIASGFLSNLRSQDVVIVIPETVTQIAEDAFRSSAIKRFVVVDNDDNKKFRVDNDALYQIVNSEESKLLRYPSLMTGDLGEYRLRNPEFTADGKTTKLAYIGEYAFEYNRFQSYTVDAGLPFHVFDGVLYEGADGARSQVLVSYPNLKSLANTEGNGTFTLPSDVNEIYKAALSLTEQSELKKFAVDSGNSVYFADRYGVLYRVDNDAQAGKLCTLVKMPPRFAGENGTYIVGEGLTYQDMPITVTNIAEGAFENVTGVMTIVFSPGEEDAVPSLANVNAFKNCSAYFLVDNARYDDFKAKENWSSVVLYTRYSYVTYVTDGAIPQDLANLFAPDGYRGSLNGFVKQVQTITQVQELQYTVNAELSGLLRIPYSEIEGWYYDAAFAEKVNFGTNSSLVKGDTVLYAKWIVAEKASKPVAVEGEENEYFNYYPVYENGTPVSYEIGFLMSSGITELKEIVIPSYYSSDGTEKNRLPVTGFYDDGSDTTKYNGFANLETLVLPETFRKFRNIFRVSGEGIIAPKKLKAIVILSKETSYINPEHVLETTTEDLRTIISFIENTSAFSYYFHDYTTYSAYRQNNVWGSSAGIRGKLLSTILEVQITNPLTNESVPETYFRLQSGVETLSSYDRYETLAPSFFGYEFDKWEIYSVSVGSDGTETLTYVGDADPASTTFGGTGQPQPNARNDRFVLKAVYRESPPETV